MLFSDLYINTQYSMIPTGLIFIYLMYALMSFFKGNDIVNLIKVLFTYLVAFIFYAGLAFGLSFFIVWLKTK